jgi:hypothetical protein
MKRKCIPHEQDVVQPFPEEIWISIFDDVCRSTWSSVLATCKYFNRVAQDIFIDKLTAPNEVVDYEYNVREELRELFSG